jgi:hypothetical protein
MHLQDIEHGYWHPEQRAALKILSFLQPIFMFRNELWPPSPELRGAIASRLRVVLPLHSSSTGMAWGPDTLHNDVADCIPANPPLLKVLTDKALQLLIRWREAVAEGHGGG